jgi:serine phosphatase RsbU (regulator of sigma subunit)/Tfp pilus assembly protein PilF
MIIIQNIKKKYIPDELIHVNQKQLQLLVLILWMAISPVFASKSDSLIQALNNVADSGKYTIYKALYHELKDTPDSALIMVNEALEIAEKEDNAKQIANFHSIRGHVYERLGKIPEAIEEFAKAHDFFLQDNNIELAAQALQNRAAMHIDNGQYNDASKHLFTALRLTEEHNLINLKGSVLTNIGLLFFNQDDWDKSIYYYNLSVDIHITTNDLEGLALLYNNLGISYYYKNKLDSVLINFQRSLEMYIQLDDQLGQTRPLSNIGEIYYLKGDYDKAFEYFNRSLSIEKELGYKSGYAISLLEIGNLYTELGEFPKALKYQYQGLEVLNELGSLSKKMDAYSYLYDTYNKMNNADSALKYFQAYSEIKDSIFSIENSKHINELEKIYETEKKEQQIALQNIKIRNHKIQVWTLIIILALVLGIVVQIMRINRNKRKTNLILEEKNRQLAENNRQITNSITYASVIQAAILPPIELFRKTFPQHFILFKPKDIVSGDFYWLTKKEEIIIVAVADCTGHGVPGAFMSMLGISYLNEIINIQKIQSTNEILNLMRSRVINALCQKENQFDTRDGIDIALCALNTKTLEMEFSGAYRSVVILSGNETTIVEGDKMPIGFHRTRKSSFSTKKHQLKKNDIFYLYSDGFPDQFGGEQGKKYTRLKFREFLSTISLLSLEEQKEKLEKELKTWQGSYDQIDDITIMGIKI